MRRLCLLRRPTCLVLHPNNFIRKLYFVVIATLTVVALYD